MLVNFNIKVNIYFFYLYFFLFDEQHRRIPKNSLKARNNPIEGRKGNLRKGII